MKLTSDQFIVVNFCTSSYTFSAYVLYIFKMTKVFFFFNFKKGEIKRRKCRFPKIKIEDKNEKKRVRVTLGNQRRGPTPHEPSPKYLSSQWLLTSLLSPISRITASPPVIFHQYFLIFRSF